MAGTTPRYGVVTPSDLDHKARELKERILAQLKSKPWFQDNPECIIVQYDMPRDVYEITMWWIEDWRPGNYGFRMRSDFEIFPGESVAKAIDLARWDALLWHHEMGLYPNNPARRQEWLNRHKKTITG